MQKVMMVGLIAIPLVLFMAFFSNKVVDNTQTNASDAKTEAGNLMTNAKAGAF